MKKRRLLISTLALVLVLAGVSAYSSHAASGIKSSGRMHYDNGTVDNPADDVLFDSDDLKILDTSITGLDTRITNISDQIGEGLGEILDAINQYPGVDLETGDGEEGGPSFKEIARAIGNITVIPADTYFYEAGTEGGSEIVRFKKVDGKYYLCDSHGVVAAGASEVDVSQKNLIAYGGAAAGNISAGKAGFSDGYLHLGDSSDQEAYFEEKFEQRITDYGYVKLISLGTGTTFDVKNYYENYSSLTSDNFFIQPAGSISAKDWEGNASIGHNVGSYGVKSLKANINLAYDSSTGILTASLSASASGGANDDSIKNVSKTADVTAYLIIQ